MNRFEEYKEKVEALLKHGPGLIACPASQIYDPKINRSDQNLFEPRFVARFINNIILSSQIKATIPVSGKRMTRDELIELRDMLVSQYRHLNIEFTLEDKNVQSS